MVTLDTICTYLERKGIDYTIHNKYDGSEEPVLIANWNNVPDKMVRFIEDNFETDWEDECDYCCECGKHIHTTPGYYGDLPKWVYSHDGECVCKDCFKNDPDNLDILITYSDDKSKSNAGYYWMLPMVEQAGFVLFNTEEKYESGFHPGQNDDPIKIKNWIYEAHGSVPTLFIIVDAGQFDVHFNAYWKEKEEE